MVGGTREAVRWDQGDPPIPNVGAQQQPQQQQPLQPGVAAATACSPSPSNNHLHRLASSGGGGGCFGSAKDVLGDGLSFEDNDNLEEEEDGGEDDGEEDEDGTGHFGGNIGDGAMVRTGSGVRSGSQDGCSNSKEVRYAPSPTSQSNPPATTCHPLQRAHSRFCLLVLICLTVSICLLSCELIGVPPSFCFKYSL